MIVTENTAIPITSKIRSGIKILEDASIPLFTPRMITPEIIEKYQVIVNTTPAGMYPHVDTCPDIPYHLLTPQYLCYDVVYNPEVTLFMKKSQEQGAMVKNGLEMLILQALAAWEIWNS